MERKFKVLRIIGSIYKILGIIAAAVTVLMALGVCLSSVLGGAMMTQFERQMGMGGLLGGALGGVVIGGFVLLGGAVYTLMLYGIGEGIFLLLALEENTRTTAALMRQYSGEQPEL